MPSKIFNAVKGSNWPLFTTVDHVRLHFDSDISVMIAIGGWGDTDGFATAAATECGRKRFARNVKTMIDATGADGLFFEKTALQCRTS